MQQIHKTRVFNHGGLELLCKHAKPLNKKVSEVKYLCQAASDSNKPIRNNGIVRDDKDLLYYYAGPKPESILGGIPYKFIVYVPFWVDEHYQIQRLEITKGKPIQTDNFMNGAVSYTDTRPSGRFNEYSIPNPKRQVTDIGVWAFRDRDQMELIIDIGKIQDI